MEKQKKLGKELLEIFTSKTCSRKDYWCVFGIILAIYAMLIVISIPINIYFSYYFNFEFYITFWTIAFIILTIFFQVKRYRDVHMNLYIFVLLGILYIIPWVNIVASIIHLIILLLPTYSRVTENQD